MQNDGKTRILKRFGLLFCLFVKPKPPNSARIFRQPLPLVGIRAVFNRLAFVSDLSTFHELKVSIRIDYEIFSLSLQAK
jgi:hypothetical protein